LIRRRSARHARSVPASRCIERVTSFDIERPQHREISIRSAISCLTCRRNSIAYRSLFSRSQHAAPELQRALRLRFPAKPQQTFVNHTLMGEVMKRTLIASAFALAFGTIGSAWAQDTITDNAGAAATGASTATQTTADTNSALSAASAAASNGATATSTMDNSFNVNNVSAVSTLSGAVTGVTVAGVGNVASNSGTTVAGSSTSTGIGGPATSTTGQTSGAATSLNAPLEGGALIANTAGNDVTTNSDTATGGTATSGDARARSGLNAAATLGGDGNSASGAGGEGGYIRVSAGRFDMSNTMNGTAQSASGILVASQNSGAASLVQQSVNVQANLSLGH
jgi:hypothetical protein